MLKRADYYQCHLAIVLISMLIVDNYVSAENIHDKRMAVFTFNATLPMMQFTIDGINFHTQVFHISQQVFRENANTLIYYIIFVIHHLTLCWFILSRVSQLLQMNSKELQESRIEALEYFQETFGVNVEEHERDVTIRNYETNPLANMRCIYLSGSNYYIPPEGLVVRDGGWMLTVINPHGII